MTTLLNEMFTIVKDKGWSSPDDRLSEDPEPVQVLVQIGATDCNYATAIRQR